jgi:transposase
VSERNESSTEQLKRLRGEVKRAEQERDRLQRERDRLQRDTDRLRREREGLQREIERLRKALDAARREAKRQAAPFSKGKRKAKPKRPGRKPGRKYGPRGRRPIPSRVDETYEAPLPKHCPDCGGGVKPQRIATQYQEELPVVQPLVRAFRVHVGCCTRCRRRVQGRHPLQTSDALGAAAVHLGPQAVALAAMLNKQFGLSFGKVAALFRQRFSLSVTPGGLVQALHRVADKAQPSYQALCATVRSSPAVSPDETGWRVSALLVWLWAFVTQDTTVYAILPGRGHPEAASILGEDFAGGLSRDGWAVYRQFGRAIHQTCLAHLLRRCKQLQEDHPHAALPPQVAALLKAGLAVRDRRDRGEISARGAMAAGGRLSAQLLEVIERPSTIPAVERFAKHLATEFVAVFSFLFDSRLDATNWRAEQAIRPAVVTRKMCGGGNRTWKGAETQQILATFLRTACQRGLDPTDLLVQIQRSPLPIVPQEFQPPVQ